MQARQNAPNYYSPSSVGANNEPLGSDNMPGETRASVHVVPQRHHRPSGDESAADSGIHSNDVPSQAHSVGPDGDYYDRSSTPSRSVATESKYDQDPSMALGTPHLSPWLTNQLVDQKSAATNTDPFKHRAEKREWPAGPLRHIATDTDEMVREDGDEIKRLKQIIADLECDLKVKQRELETARFVQKGLEDKVKNAEDSFTWKAKVKDKERDLTNKDRLVRNVMDEVNIRNFDETKKRKPTLLQLTDCMKLV